MTKERTTVAFGGAKRLENQSQELIVEFGDAIIDNRLSCDSGCCRRLYQRASKQPSTWITASTLRCSKAITPFHAFF
ncbi:hypothetical protein SESBI_16650 [Sesbania bispinosa]|nr:hypothetical protein SESBI_16650 [Sesbania bispinosa]